jgi:hypothetical protein
MHGSRTKRVILEIYDAMAEAISIGKPYCTLLDPPPLLTPASPICPGRLRSGKVQKKTFQTEALLFFNPSRYRMTFPVRALRSQQGIWNSLRSYLAGCSGTARGNGESRILERRSTLRKGESGGPHARHRRF